MTEAHRCEQTAQGCYSVVPSENQTHDLMITSPRFYCYATVPSYLVCGSQLSRHAASQIQLSIFTGYQQHLYNKVKVKNIYTRCKSGGSGADPGICSQLTGDCHYFPPGLQLPPHHHTMASAKLYCLMTEANRCELLAQGCYAVLPQPGPLDN